MMTLYSHNGAPPAPLPDVIWFSNGDPRTNRETFTPEEIADAGYIEAPAKPSYDPTTQHSPVWTGTDWTIADKSEAELQAEFEARKAAKITALAQRRWEAETGGIFVGGMPIPTDDKTQDRVDQIVKAFADGDISGTVDFKSVTSAGTIWASADEATMRAIKAAGAAHIQACFANERTLYEAVIAADDDTALDAVDLDAGWPV